MFENVATNGEQTTYKDMLKSIKIFFLLLLVLTTTLVSTSGCAIVSDDWNDIDYSRVRGGSYESDSYYTMPSVIGCIDDDLFNCN